MVLHHLFVTAFIVSLLSTIFPQIAHQSEAGSVETANVVCRRPCFDGSRVSTTMQSTSNTVVKDFNNDGILDIANQSGPFQTLSVQFGLGNGFFSDPVMIDASSSAFYLVAGDFNNDGNADLLTGVKIYFGDGSGGFSAPRLLNLVANASLYVVGDFNGDDKLDLAGQEFSTHNVDVFYGDGTGGFSSATVVDFNVGNVETFNVADLNSDGISDIAATITSGNSVSVAFGLASGGFSVPVNYPVGGTGSVAKLAIGDLDDDGDPDILASTVDFSSDARMVVLLNSGTGTFTAQPQFVEPSADLERLLFADISSDGKLDLVAANPTGVLVVRQGNGNGTFQAGKRIPGLPGQSSIYFSEFCVREFIIFPGVKNLPCFETKQRRP